MDSPLSPRFPPTGHSGSVGVSRVQADTIANPANAEGALYSTGVLEENTPRRRRLTLCRSVVQLDRGHQHQGDGGLQHFHKILDKRRNTRSRRVTSPI